MDSGKDEMKRKLLQSAEKAKAKWQADQRQKERDRAQRLRRQMSEQTAEGIEARQTLQFDFLNKPIDQEMDKEEINREVAEIDDALEMMSFVQQSRLTNMSWVDMVEAEQPSSNLPDEDILQLEVSEADLDLDGAPKKPPPEAATVAVETTVTAAPKPPAKLRCWNCGGRGHTIEDCKRPSKRQMKAAATAAQQRLYLKTPKKGEKLPLELQAAREAAAFLPEPPKPFPFLEDY